MAKTKNKIEKEKKGGRNPLLIFISLFLACVLLFTGVFMAVSSSKKKNSVAYYGTVAMDKETASYFVTRYKSSYKSRFENATDTKFFWNSEASDGKTHGEKLVEETREYIKYIIVTNYLFDRYATLSDAQIDNITEAVNGTVASATPGADISSFEKEVKKYGFDYDSYKTAAIMLYKSQMAEMLICGQNGSALKGETELISEYLSEYSHVKLLVIRTKNTFKTDDNGNRVKDSYGHYVLRDLTSEEIDERQSLIAKIKGYIDATGSDASMSEYMFNSYLATYDEGDAESHTYGYYLHDDSEFYKGNRQEEGFKDKYPLVAEKIKELGNITDEPKFGYADLEYGVCFIYKYAVSLSDLEVSSLSACFGDFYKNLSAVFFGKSVSELIPFVTVKKKFSEIDIIGLPYNGLYFPKF